MGPRRIPAFCGDYYYFKSRFIISLLSNTHHRCIKCVVGLRFFTERFANSGVLT